MWCFPLKSSSARFRHIYWILFFHFGNPDWSKIDSKKTSQSILIRFIQELVNNAKFLSLCKSRQQSQVNPHKRRLQEYGHWRVNIIKVIHTREMIFPISHRYICSGLTSNLPQYTSMEKLHAYMSKCILCLQPRVSLLNISA